MKIILSTILVSLNLSVFGTDSKLLIQRYLDSIQNRLDFPGVCVSFIIGLMKWNLLTVDARSEMMRK